MKQLVLLLAILLCGAGLSQADIKLAGMKGKVQVRHGVSEDWTTPAPGDILKPEDSIRMGKKSKAVLSIDGRDRLTLPEMVIVDVSDLRKLSQEELLLMLAMQDVRSVPGKDRKDELNIPRTTTVHGANQGNVPSAIAADPDAGTLLLNGTKVLYDNGYYATCILKAKDVYRQLPVLAKNIGSRLIVASALERLSLFSEALTEYAGLSQERLSPRQKALVEEKLARLKRKGGE